MEIEVPAIQAQVADFIFTGDEGHPNQ